MEITTKTTAKKISKSGCLIEQSPFNRPGDPQNKLIVVTGFRDQGKSSLVIDTLFSEGQRRYVESLSAYARQFLHRMKKPEVDYITGLWSRNRHRTKGDQ